MRFCPNPKDTDQLVLASEEGPLACIGLDPSHQVQHCGIDVAASRDKTELSISPPMASWRAM
jgi:hypothetical protein